MASRNHVQRAIELYEQELARYPNVTGIGVVPVTDDSDSPADLAVAEYLAELIDVTAPGGEQTLHRKLRRRAQEEGSRQAVDACGKRLDLRIGHGRGAQDRRLNLEHTARLEESSGSRGEVRALRQHLPLGARPPRERSS